MVKPENLIQTSRSNILKMAIPVPASWTRLVKKKKNISCDNIYTFDFLMYINDISYLSVTVMNP